MKTSMALLGQTLTRTTTTTYFFSPLFIYFIIRTNHFTKTYSNESRYWYISTVCPIFNYYLSMCLFLFVFYLFFIIIFFIFLISFYFANKCQVWSGCTQDRLYLGVIKNNPELEPCSNTYFQG